MDAQPRMVAHIMKIEILTHQFGETVNFFRKGLHLCPLETQPSEVGHFSDFIIEAILCITQYIQCICEAECV